MTVPTDAFWNNLGTIITALGVIYVAYQNTKLRGEVKEVHQTTNSKMDLLLRTAKDASYAEGKEEQRLETAGTRPTVPAAIPLVVSPDAQQDKVVAYFAQGVAQGILMEKKRRADEGNGPTKS